MATKSAKDIARAFNRNARVLFLEALSNNETNDLILNGLRELIPTGDGYYIWIVDVWPDYVIYQYERPGESTAYFKRPYLLADDGAVEFGDPVEVERRTEYVTVGEAAKVTKTDGGKEFPASDYAYVPDASKPSTWKLRLTKTPGGPPDPNIVGSAAAALGKGFRGQKVEIPAADLPAVKRKVRAAWKKANPDKEAEDMPEGIKESVGGVPVVGQIIELLETSVRPDGTVPIKIIEPGWGSSAFYPAEALEKSGPAVFTKGTQMFWDHMTEAEQIEQPEGELNNLAAVLETDARWVPNHPKGPGLYADARVFGPFDEKLDELAPYIGTSIHTDGLVETDRFGQIVEKEIDGRSGPILTEFIKTPFTSVDFVTKPGAGGAVLQLFESLRPHKTEGRSPMEAIELKETQEKLTAAEAKVAEFEAKEAAAAAEKAQKALTEEATVAITEALKDKELPDAAKARIMASLSKAPPVKDGKLDTEALLLKVVEVSTEEAAYVESITKAGTVQGMGGGSGEDDGKKKLREAVKRAHPTWPDAQVDIYVNGR